MKGVLHLTVGFPPNADMASLEASSRRNGFAFKALPQFWNAARLAKIQKLSVLRGYLDSGEVRPDQVVLFTDAYDTLVLCRAEYVLERFVRIGCDILFSAEVNFFPKEDRDPKTQALFETFASKWRYLNSGGYVGYAWAVLAMLRHAASIQTADSRSDQMLTQEFFRHCTETGALRVGLDTGPELFASLNASYNDFSWQGAAVRGGASDQPVAVLHGNGDKDNLRILRGLSALLAVPVVPDLRIVKIGREVVRYDPAARRLVRARGDFADIVFAIAHANLRAALFTARHGCLSFTPDGAVIDGRDDLRSWETVWRRPTLRSTHGLDLAAHLAEPPPEPPALSHFTLALLREPEFAAVAAHAVRLAPLLADRPDLGPMAP